MTCDIKIDSKNYCQNEVEYYGRWLGYCEAHKVTGKEQDRNKTYENEVKPDLESGNFSYIANDSELQEVLETL